MPTPPKPVESVLPPGVDVTRGDYGDLPEGTIIGYFTRKQKLIRFGWFLVQSTIYRFSPRRADRWRAFLLRLFGAKVGAPKILRNTARFEVPWNIELGDDVTIGDGVLLYSLGRISIGDHAVISQFSHICAGTHDHTSTMFMLLRSPIEIGRHAWISAEVYVGPGLTIGDGVLVGARSNVVKDLPAWRICVGNPARPVAPRILRDHRTGDRLDPNTDDTTEPGAGNDAGDVSA